jgi:hypothetical protein
MPEVFVEGIAAEPWPVTATVPWDGSGLAIPVTVKRGRTKQQSSNALPTMSEKYRGFMGERVSRLFSFRPVSPS